jgi:superfamily II DNA or RNA helicase
VKKLCSYPLDSKKIPQADKPERVIEFVRLIEKHGEAEARAKFDQRDFNYYTSAAASLGFLDEQRNLTSSGRALARMRKEARLARMALAFENSECGGSWCRHQGVDSILKLDLRSAETFLREGTQISPETAHRRATSLRRWLRVLSAHHPEVRRPQPNASDRRLARALARQGRVRFARGEAGALITSLSKETRYLRIATAYFSIKGYEAVEKRAHEAVLQLLVGTPEAVRELEPVLRRFRESIDRGPPTPSKRKRVEHCHYEMTSGRVHVRALDPRYKKLHGKVYIFDDNCVLITSANLTQGGLYANIEASSLVTEPREVVRCARQFDEYFGDAKIVNDRFLREMEESWVFAPPASPYLVYLRTLLEIFGNVPELLDSELKLAEFQRLIVGSVLGVLRENRGLLLISPTGTGKTVMGAYVAASVFNKGYQRVFVLCPNRSLARQWERHFSKVNCPVAAYTHGELQGKGRETSDGKERLDDLISRIRETDLVIVDECHAFRNLGRKGARNLTRLLTGGKYGKPGCLLLTATPISTGLENLNSLLSFVSKEKLESIEQVSRASHVVNVTVPFIQNAFGVTHRGVSGALKFDKEYRFFPKIYARTEKYRPSFVRLLRAIEKVQFVFHRLARGTRQRILRDMVVEDLPLEADVSRLFHLLLMRHVESSPRAIIEMLERLRRKNYKMGGGPVNLHDFRKAIGELLVLARALGSDTKVKKLLRHISARSEGERILVFTTYVATAEYLVDAIRKEFKGVRVESLTGKEDAKARKQKLKRFSPMAQGLGRRRRSDGIDVLVATDAIGEGENLQDATTLINYDLHWTPLKLIQRVGRLDRPTRELREVKVWNFYPGGAVFERMMRLFERLKDRSRIYEALARVRVVGDVERDFENANARDVGLVRALYEEEDYERLLLEYMPTSVHLAVRAKADAADEKKAWALKLGARAVIEGKNPGLFALLRWREQVFCVFENASGIRSSPDQVAHESILSSIRVEADTAGLKPVKPGKGLDARLSRLVKRWAKDHEGKASDVQVVCAMEILPENGASVHPRV